MTRRASENWLAANINSPGQLSVVDFLPSLGFLDVDEAFEGIGDATEPDEQPVEDIDEPNHNDSEATQQYLLDDNKTVQQYKQGNRRERDREHTVRGGHQVDSLLTELKAFRRLRDVFAVIGPLQRYGL
jgi:hypothetical protein